MYRLYLKCLLLTGNNKETARIDFTNGLNVISGPSDTGKTFIFQCLDYCLGASNNPKKIKETDGYTLLKLSFEIDGKPYTIFRDFTTNNIKLYEANIDNITDSTIPITVATNKFSEFLMEKLGISNAKLLRNQKGDTVNLTISKFRGLSFIDETEIQSENSPFLSGERMFQTQEKAFINYILKGINYNDVIKEGSKEIAQAKIQAKIDLLEELIGDTSKIPSENEIEENSEQIEKLKNAISVANNKFFDINKSVNSLEDARVEKYATIIKIKSNIAYKEETANRFNLLLDRYQVDIERLSAILQSSNLFLSAENKLISCPLCKTKIYNKDEKIEPQYITSIKESCENEIAKIEKLKSELKLTIDTIQKEKSEQQQILTSLEKELLYIQNNLSTIVKTEISKIKDELYTLYSKKSSLEALGLKYKNLIELMELKQTNKNALNNKSPKSTFDTSVKTTTMFELCNYIYNTLKSWDFPELKTVSFSEENNDIVIGDKNRKAFGKGYRAITRSAFNIALMKYCIDKNLPHLGFIVLDSPVLTFRGIDKKSTNGEEFISDELKDKFYAELSKYKNDTQIIIIENKEPPAEIIKDINYIHFTKSKNNGRYGFIPVE